MKKLTAVLFTLVFIFEFSACKTNENAMPDIRESMKSASKQIEKRETQTDIKAEESKILVTYFSCSVFTQNLAGFQVLQPTSGRSSK